MSRYWSELVKRLTPYVPGEQPGGERVVKLNTNESPYPPAPGVMEALCGVTGDELRRYPDPQSARLREAFARQAGVQQAQVFVGNGSDEVLAFAFMGLLQQSLPLYFPDVTYSFYPVWSELCGIDYREVPVESDYSINPLAFPASNGGIILPNPNAPTGLLLSLGDIRRLLEHSRDSVVVVDEAYIDFGGDSAVSLIADYDNLLVVQTLSKSRSLAGLRVGVAFGNEALIEALDRVKNSFNSYPLDAPAERAALASLADDAYFVQSCERIVSSRARLQEGLAALGFDVLPSAANFVFAQHSSRPAREIFSALRERGVLVRYFDRPRIDNFLRISVGTDEECELLLTTLGEILA